METGQAAEKAASRRKRCEALVRPFINTALATLLTEGWAADEIFIAFCDGSDAELATFLEAAPSQSEPN